MNEIAFTIIGVSFLFEMYAFYRCVVNGILFSPILETIDVLFGNFHSIPIQLKLIQVMRG